MGFPSKQFLNNPISFNRCSTKCGSSEDEVACQDCGLDPICDELDYTEEGSGVPEGILIRRRPIARGEAVFNADQPFRSIFAVKSGSFKALLPSNDGRGKVVGFYLPGELIGVEAYSSGGYSFTVRALENSSLCEIRMEDLPRSGKPLDKLQKAVIELLGQEVAFSRSINMDLVRQNADQRVAAFLVGLSRRLSERGMPWREFSLTMSRTDIASYLGLANETVSRILTRFQKNSWILIRQRRIVLTEFKELVAVSDCS